MKSSTPVQFAVGKSTPARSCSSQAVITAKFASRDGKITSAVSSQVVFPAPFGPRHEALLHARGEFLRSYPGKARMLCIHCWLRSVVVVSWCHEGQDRSLAGRRAKAYRGSWPRETDLNDDEVASGWAPKMFIIKGSSPEEGL
ncbi:hypothetical protein JX266_009427 [Neoarthrinium moseri]|nr:hypothetical protein JX266_009427 [Neoarthrinium moseri]